MRESINEVIQKAAKVRKLTEHQTATVERAVTAIADLLTNHFKSIESYRDENSTATANVAFKTTIGYDSGAAYVRTTIGFSKKVSDKREDTVGDPNQKDWIEDTKDDEIPKPKATKGKK